MTLNSKISGRSAISAIAAATALLAVGPAAAADEFKLALGSGCLVCHRGVEQRIGPPYAEVARKYAGQANAAATLAEHILKGTGPAGQGWMKEGKASLPFMPPNEKLAASDALKLATWILAINGEVAEPSRFVTQSLAVSGIVLHPLTLSVEDLKTFPRQQTGEIPAGRQSGAKPASAPESIRGVLLKDILERAAVVARDPNDVKKMMIIATASDEYKVVFSWSELFNSPVGDGVLVFYEKSGQALADNEGRIAMLSMKDTRSGPRHVKWLKSIEVRKVVD